MKIYVTDVKFGDYHKYGPFETVSYHKYGPFETVRIDSVSDDGVTLLCGMLGEDSSYVTVSYGMVISVEDEEG